MHRFLIALALAYIFSTGLALAAPQCNERDDVLKMLGKKYGETVSAVGVSNTGGLIEVVNDPKDGSWTIIMTTPWGMSCLVAAGQGWHDMEQDFSMAPEA